MRGQAAAGLAMAFVAVLALGGCAAWCRRPATETCSPAQVDRPTADPPDAPSPAQADLKPSKRGASFATAGPALGSRDVQPSGCVNGGHYEFLGADVVDEERHTVVRTVEDPIEGTVVRVFDDDDSDRASFVLRHDDCHKLVAKITSTGSWINGINVVSIELDLDCRTPAGDAIVGSFQADECE